MVAQLRERTGLRHALAALAVLALALKIMMPPGFMPGSSLAAPIILCPGQGAMPAMEMAHGGGHAPSDVPQRTDHPCAFAGGSMAPAAVPHPDADVAPAVVASIVVPAAARARSPGRGLAAPPPPRAPPAFRT